MARWWRRVIDAQIETQGKYSLQRVVALATYRRETSTLKVFAVLALTPLPDVLVTVLVDAVPLARSDEGLKTNGQFLIRHFYAFWLFVFSATVQFTHYLLSLHLSRTRIALHAIVVSASITGYVYAVSCVLLLTYIYPTYFYVYTLLPPTGRIGCAFLLSVIKLLIRMWFSHSVVVLNAEVYNSLFVMYYVHNTPSLLTTLGLMAIDFVQSAMAVRDINHIIRGIKALHGQTRDPASGTNRHKRDGFLEKAERIIEGRADQDQQRVTSKLAWTASVAPLVVSMQKRSSSRPTLSRGSLKQIFPLSQPSTRDLMMPSKARDGIRLPPIDKSTRVTIGSSEQRYVDAIQRLLYVTEFLMLLNYVEVIIPFIYSTYLVTVHHLPNRVYYLQIDVMAGEHLNDTLLSIFLYASLQLCSLLTLRCVLVYKLKLPGLVQLAFVLHSQWVGVQSKLVFWVVYNAQATLQHTGADYSFSFAWLHRAPSTATSGT